MFVEELRLLFPVNFMEQSEILARIAPFLAPISEENPTGAWLRYDAVYDKIQEARREDDAFLDQGVWQKALKKSDWQLTQKLCSDVLTSRSKDLQITVWMLESWMHLRGFEGIAEGITLVSALCQTYWDSIYPALEENDCEYRIAPLQWLNEKIFHKPKIIPCTQPRSRDLPVYNFLDWEGILSLENTLRKNPFTYQPDELEQKITREKFRISMLDTPLEYYTELNAILLHSIEELNALERFTDEKCGKQAPSFRHFREVLTKIERLSAEILKERTVVIEPEPEPEPEPIVDEFLEDAGISDDFSELYVSLHPPAPEPVVEQSAPERLLETPIAVRELERKVMQTMSVAVRSREDAYKRLNEAADYLLKAEPHSPVPYLIKRAISWGDMPLPQLLGELILDPNYGSAIVALLGMQPPQRKDEW